MRAARLARRYWVDLVALSIAFIVFIVPFIFIVVTAAKTQAEASSLDFSWPTDWKIVENLQAVLSERNGIMITALRNSLVLTVASVAITVILASMIAFVIQRRRDRVAALVSGLFLAGSDHPSGRGADDLPAPGTRALQDAGGTHPRRGRIRDALCHPRLRGLRVGHPEGAR